MIKNNNHKVINKLTFRSLKTGKMRNFFIILTVSLSVAFLTGTALFSLGLNQSNRMLLSKMQHVVYANANELQIEQIKNDSRVEDILIYKKGNAQEIDNYQLIPEYISTDCKIIENIQIIEGNYPVKQNEVAIDLAYLRKTNKSVQINETIQFDWIDKTSEEFIITGFYDSKQSSNTYVVLLSKEYAVKGSQLKNVQYMTAIRIKDATKMDKDTFLSEIRSVGQDVGIERHNINENNYFVINLSYTASEIIMIASIGFAVVLISVLVIYSIFYISVTARVKQFGQLRTIGMTPKQIKRMINREGLILSLFGTPIGILVGTTFAYMINPEGFLISNAIVVAILGFIINMITVLISIRKPAKIAASVSPIDMSKTSGYSQTKIKNRQLTPFGLAKISDSRNRKKSLMTMVSLGMAGVLFIVGTTLLASINEIEYSKQSQFRFGEYILTLSSNAIEINEKGLTGVQLNNDLSNQLETKIRNIENVKNVMTTKKLQVEYKYNDYHAMDSFIPFQQSQIELLNQFSEYEFNYNEMVLNKEIIITDNEVAKEIFGWNFKPKDKIEIRWFNGSEYLEEVFTIAGDIDANKLLKDEEGYKMFLNAGWFMVPEELMKNMMIDDFNFNYNMIVSIDNYSNQDEKMTELLYEIIDEYPELRIKTLTENIELNKSIYEITYTTILGFAIFIIGFATINLINTLISNAVSRKQEFAMLRSIGMSEKQLSKMIQSEGIILAVKNIIFTSTIGIIVGYTLIKLLNNLGVSYLNWHFPLLYLIGYTIFILIVPIIISLGITTMLRQKSLVERLKETE